MTVTTNSARAVIRVLVIAAALNCVLCARVTAQTAYPMLMSISPVASQVGTTSEHTIRSRYTLEGAYKVLVSGDGVQAKILPMDESNATAMRPGKSGKQEKAVESIKVQFEVSADALPGVRDVRIATPTGISTVGQLVIVRDPVQVENVSINALDLSTVASFPASTIPATLCGCIEKAEDVDYFRVQVTRPQHICVHVMCMRLEDRIHDLQTHADPIVFVRDDRGSIIATADNTFSADPLICCDLPRAGDYFIEIRDVRYQGNTYWEYCIEMNSRPLVTCLYPIGVPMDKDAVLQPLGYGLEHAEVHPVEAKITSDQLKKPGLNNVAADMPGIGKKLLPIVVTANKLALEAATDNDDVAHAQTVEIPMGINGRIERESDVDCYKFQASRGTRYSFEVFARRAGSSLDSHLRLLDSKGNQLQLSDDLKVGKRSSADSWIENWSVPEDGQYVLEIRDLHSRGGDAFAYFIEITESQPGFFLFTDTDKTPISPGTSGVLYVRCEKKNGFDSEIQLAVDGLPDGVQAHCGRILRGKSTDGCIVFQAKAGMAPITAPITVYGTAVVEPTEKPDGVPTFIEPGNNQSRRVITQPAIVYQEIYQPGGGRGHWPVESHVVAVMAPADIEQVKVSTTQIKLQPGKSVAIDVDLTRAPGFGNNVTLEANYSHLNTIFGNSLPEGVTVDSTASNTLLTSGATKGRIVLKAAESAPEVKDQLFAVMANVSINFVMKATYASPPILISVEK